MQEHYDDKEDKVPTYFDYVRKVLLDLIPTNLRGGVMLEIGAAGGNTSLYAKHEGYADKIYGVELCEIEESNQKDSAFSDFIIGDLEKIELPFEEKSFDVILCGDVLEHLVDPYAQVDRLRNLLKDEGRLIVSLPNIRQWRTIKKILVKGDFKYEDSGILDRTHLRFFTKKNMIDLFEQRGFKVEKIVPNDMCSTEKRNPMHRFFKKLSCIKRHLFEEFYAMQYYLVISKK